MRRANCFIPVLVFLVAIALPAHAQSPRTSPEQAARFVQDVSTRIVGLLAAPEAADGRRVQEQIQGLIRESVDLDTIGRSSLGSAWQRATDGQRREYQEVFATWAANTYAERLGANRGGSLSVLSAVPNAADAYVRTRITRADGRSSILDLRVRDSAGGMRIVDAEVDGISMDVTQRDEFASVVRRQGLDALIASLRAQVATTSPQARN